MNKILNYEEKMYVKWCLIFTLMFFLNIKWSTSICDILEISYKLCLPMTGINIIFALTLIITINTFYITYKFMNYLTKVI